MNLHDLETFVSIAHLGGVTRVLSSGESPVWGADSRHLIFSEGGGLYMLDTVNSRKSKILDGLGKITEPSWSR